MIANFNPTFGERPFIFIIFKQVCFRSMGLFRKEHSK